MPFDSTFQSAGFTYSDNDQVASRTVSAWLSTRATIEIFPTDSKKQWEYELIDAGDENIMLGFAITTFDGNTYTGDIADTVGYFIVNGNVYIDGVKTNVTTAGTGDIVTVFYDPATGNFWLAINGTILQGDSVAGTDPVWTVDDTLTYRPFVAIHSAGSIRINDSENQLNYPLLSGYSSLLAPDLEWIQSVFRVRHGDILQRTIRISHGLYPQVLKVFLALPGAAPLRIKTIRIVHDQARSFAKIFRVVHQQSTFIQKVFRVIQQQKDGDLIKIFRVVHGTRAGEAVLKIFRVIHGLVADSFRGDTFDVSLRVGNQPVLSWSAATLSTDEGRFVWEAQITVHQQWDAETLLGQYDSVIYRRYGTDYHLIVVDRSRAAAIGPDDYTDAWTVQLASPAYKLSAGTALPVTKTWARGTAAKSIVQELCDAKSIPLDWQAPEYVLAELVADKQSPIDIIRTVCNVIGALPQSAPSGALVIRKETPVMPDNKVMPSSTFAALSIVQLAEQSDDPAVLYNAVQVSDSTEPASDAGGLQHVETDRTDGGKDIQAWSETWDAVALRVNSVSGETTLSSGKLVVADYLDSEGEPEWVQFVDGKATVSRPVYQGFTLVDFRGDDPGEISWQPDSKDLASSGGGEYYVQIAYKWRYYEFVYYSETGDNYQLVLTDG
jgi:hypothetical protein